VLAAAGVLLVTGVGLMVYALRPTDRPAPELAENPAPKPAPPPAKDGTAAAPADGRMPPETLAKVKKATVYLRVAYADGSVGSGSGFCVPGGPGLIVTNAHVVGQGGKAGPRTVSRIDAVLHSGEPNARTLAARLLGADPEADLALLQVTGADLPEPLVVGDSSGLQETQEVYVFGFPFGENLGKNITVSKTSVSSLRRGTPGVPPLIQVNGGMHPGNSGGPVTDGAGNVVGVAQAGILGTQINQAIAGEAVQSFVRWTLRSGGGVATAPPAGPTGPDPGRGRPNTNTVPPAARGSVGKVPREAPNVPRPNPADPTPVVPAEEQTVIDLPGPVGTTTVGGAGRYLALYLPVQRQIAVFDTAERKVIHHLPTTDVSPLLAAGRDKLVVANSTSRTLVRYDLATGEKELTAPLPAKFNLCGLAMGSASDGPLLMASVDWPRLGEVFLVDLAKLERIDGSTRYNGRVGAAPGMVLRAAPDGRVFTAIAQSGASVIHVRGNTWTDVACPVLPPLPGADGRTVFGAGQMATIDGQPLGDRNPNASAYLPATNGPLFLSVRDEQGTLGIHAGQSARPLFAVGGVSEVVEPGGAALPPDRHLFYNPAANLLVTLPAARNRLLLRTLDLKAELAKIPTDYLVVLADLPPAVEPGKPFRYSVGVLSKKGGVKLKLDAGPDGMKVDGTTLTWDVPAEFGGRDAQVTLIVSDASGQEVFHAFGLSPAR
jgi:S1-C subfamily serine protease